MARFADRIAYRLAGLVWTALYSGLSSRSSTYTTAPIAAMEDSMPASVQTPAIAA
jgi:hypothetical protein